MADKKPKFIVVAGPNGSGKSTLTLIRKEPLGTIIIDADAIAKRLNPEDVEAVAVQAGKTAIQ